jgi:hypothetical protein
VSNTGVKFLLKFYYKGGNMSFEQKIVDTKLSDIQVGIDDIANKLFTKNEQLSKDLKMYTFEIGMVRAALEQGAQKPTTNTRMEQEPEDQICPKCGFTERQTRNHENPGWCSECGTL